MSEKEKFREDNLLWLEVLGELRIITMENSCRRARDGLTNAIREAISSNRFMLSTVFAVQNFLDIHHIFREEVASCFRELQRVGELSGHTIKQHLPFFQEVPNSSWPSDNDVSLRALAEFIEEWISVDSVGNVVTFCAEAADKPYIPKDFHLLRNHPLLCGTVCFQIRQNLQTFGIILDDCWGAIRFSAHLYNAVRQENLCTQVWQSMDYILQSHLLDIFLGGLPKDIGACDRQLKICCLGISALAFVPGRREKNSEPVPQKQLRYLEAGTPVSLMFQEQYQLPEGSFSLDRALEALKKHHQAKKPSPNADSTGTFATVQQYAPASSAVKRDKKAKKRDKSQRKTNFPHAAQTDEISPVKLLSLLQQSLSTETPRLHFDYLALQRECWSMLTKIREKILLQLYAFHGDSTLRSKGQLRFTCSDILDAAAKTYYTRTKSPLAGDITLHQLMLGGTILRNAGKEMEEVLKEQNAVADRQTSSSDS
jgi:hypothetical protein